MADEKGQSTDTVSREAHERLERQNAALQEQLDKATGALAGVSKEKKAIAVLRSQGVADPESAATLAAPFLNDVEDSPEAIAEALAHDRFKSLAKTPEPTTTTDDDGDGDGDSFVADEPAAGGFNGPSPAGSGGKPVDGKQKIAVGSPEYRDLVASNDEDALKNAYAKGLIEEPSRPWR